MDPKKAQELRAYLDILLDEAKRHKNEGNRHIGQLVISIVYDLEQMLLVGGSVQPAEKSS